VGGPDHAVEGKLRSKGTEADEFFYRKGGTGQGKRGTVTPTQEFSAGWFAAERESDAGTRTKPAVRSDMQGKS